MRDQRSNDSVPPLVDEPIAQGALNAKPNQPTGIQAVMSAMQPKNWPGYSLLSPLPTYLQQTARKTGDVIAQVPHSFDLLEDKLSEANEWANQYPALQATKTVLYGTAMTAVFLAAIWKGGFPSPSTQPSQ